MPQWSNSIDHFWYDFQFFRTITFVIYVGSRFNNMSPNKTGIHYQVEAYKHKLFLLFSCGLIFAPSTSLLPLLLLYTFHVVLFVSTHTLTHAHGLIWRKKSSATKVRVSTSVNELLSKCQQVLWPSKKYKIYRGVRQIVFEWCMVNKRAFLLIWNILCKNDCKSLFKISFQIFTIN